MAEQTLRLGIDSTAAKTGARGFESAAAKVGRAARGATGDVDNLEVGLKRLSRAADGMRAAGRKLTMFVSLPLAAVGAAATKMASDAEEAANKFDVVMGPAAARLREEFKSLHATIPLASHEMEGLSAGVQDLLVPMGIARESAADMSLELVKLAGDLASFNNVSTQTAMRSITSGLAGEAEALRRYGVDVRQARLETLAYEAGLVKVGEELDAAARGQAVLLAITRDSKDAIGDAARTAGSAANQLKFLGRNLKELSVTIGNQLLPVITPLVARVNEMLQAAGGLSANTVKWGIAIAGVAAVAGPLVLILGNLAAAASAAATAMAAFGVSAGIAVGVLTGGLGLIALLGGLSAMFVKNKIDAAAARGEVDQYRTSLTQLSQAAAEEKAFAIREEKARLETERGTLPAQVRRANAGRLGGAAATIANPRIAAINDEIKGLNRELGIVTRRLTDLRNDGEKATSPLATGIDLANTKAEEFRRTLKRLREEAEKISQSLSGSMFDSQYRRGARAVAGLAGGLHRKPNEMGAGGRLTTPKVNDPATGRWRDLNVPEIVTSARTPKPPKGMSKLEIQLLKLELAAKDAGKALVSGVINGAKAFGAKLLQMFNPLSIASTMLDEAFRDAVPSIKALMEPVGKIARAIGEALVPVMEALAPIFEKLAPIIAAVAQVLGAFVVALAPIFEAMIPILRALFPVFKAVAISATYVGQVFGIVAGALMHIVGGLATAIGVAIEAIGRAIDKIPFMSDLGLVGIGQGIQDFGRGLREGGDEMFDLWETMQEAREGIKAIELDDTLDALGDAAGRAAGQLLNYANVLHINALRHRTSAGITGGPAMPPGGPAIIDPVRGGGSITINVHGTTDPERIADVVVHRLERQERRGAPSGLRVALAS